MKTLYIVRGLPGTGKTTLAHQLCPWWHPLRRAIAADDYPGRYLPNGLLNPAIPHQVAHKWVFLRVEKWMECGMVDKIAVHNVFYKTAHVLPFVELAQQYNFSAQIIGTEKVYLPGWQAAQNIHNVPVDLIDRWRRDWEPMQ